MRFSTAKQFDIMGIYAGVPLAVECKLYRKFAGFGLNQLRDEQIAALNAYWEAGGRAFVALNIRIAASREKNQKHENRLLLFEWPMRFYSKAEIMAYPYISGCKGLFHLTDWLEGVKAS